MVNQDKTPQEFWEAQGRRLKEAREKAGYKTAEEAARAVGIVVPTFRLHEEGKRRIRSDVLRLYARHFGVTPEWLQNGDAGPASPQEPEPPKHLGPSPVKPPLPTGGTLSAEALLEFEEEEE